MTPDAQPRQVETDLEENLAPSPGTYRLYEFRNGEVWEEVKETLEGTFCFPHNPSKYPSPTCTYPWREDGVEAGEISPFLVWIRQEPASQKLEFGLNGRATGISIKRDENGVWSSIHRFPVEKQFERIIRIAEGNFLAGWALFPDIRNLLHQLSSVQADVDLDALQPLARYRAHYATKYSPGMADSIVAMSDPKTVAEFNWCIDAFNARLEEIKAENNLAAVGETLDKLSALVARRQVWISREGSHLKVYKGEIPPKVDASKLLEMAREALEKHPAFNLVLVEFTPPTDLRIKKCAYDAKLAHKEVTETAGRIRKGVGQILARLRF